MEYRKHLRSRAAAPPSDALVMALASALGKIIGGGPQEALSFILWNATNTGGLDALRFAAEHWNSNGRAPC